MIKVIKENKPFWVGIIIGIIIITGIAIFPIIVELNKPKLIEPIHYTYAESREGINIEVYLKHGYIIYNNETGNELVCGDSFTFYVYGYAGDTVLYRQETYNDSFRISYRMYSEGCGVFNILTTYPKIQETEKLRCSGEYTITITNYESEISGYVKIFVKILNI